MNGFRLRNTDGFVCLQFSFSNEGLVPDSIWKLLPGKWDRHETREESSVRRNASLGETVMPAVERLDVSALAGQLRRVGYELVDVVHEERKNPVSADEDGTWKFFTMLRYVFARPEIANPTDEFITLRPELLLDLDLLLKNAYWRMRPMRNQADTDAVFAGEDAVTLRLEARVQAWDKFGKPEVRWLKDQSTGERTTKVRLEPNKVFSLLRNRQVVLYPGNILR